MRPLIAIAAASSLLMVLAAPRTADACSIVDDTAFPPDTELGFDAAESPAAPVLVDAQITHYHEDDGVGCEMGGGTCGDIHGLELRLQVDPSTDLIRIDVVGGDTLYAEVYNTVGDELRIFIPRFGHDAAPEITVSALDSRGYRSEGIDVVVFNPANAESDGCSTSGRYSSWLLVLGAALIACRRRRLV